MRRLSFVNHSKGVHLDIANALKLPDHNSNSTPTNMIPNHCKDFATISKVTEETFLNASSCIDEDQLQLLLHKENKSCSQGSLKQLKMLKKNSVVALSKHLLGSSDDKI